LILNYPESFFADPGLPPLALRTEVTMQLLIIIIVIETAIIILLAPPDLRFKSLWITPLVNLLSSCLLGPTQIFIGQNDFFYPPIFLPANLVWGGIDYDSFQAILELFLAFTIFVVLLGSVAVCVEGSLARLALLPSSKHLWKQIGLANAASYLFLFGWSCWLGYSLRQKATGSSSDDFISRLTDSVGRRVSEKGIERLHTYAWLLFFLAAAVMLLIVILGKHRTREIELSDEQSVSFRLVFVSLVGGVLANLGVGYALLVFFMIAVFIILMVALYVGLLFLLLYTPVLGIRTIKKKRKKKGNNGPQELRLELNGLKNI
jgi:hypothetical protein